MEYSAGDGNIFGPPGGGFGVGGRGGGSLCCSGRLAAAGSGVVPPTPCELLACSRWLGGASVGALERGVPRVAGLGHCLIVSVSPPLVGGNQPTSVGSLGDWFPGRCPPRRCSGPGRVAVVGDLVCQSAQPA